MQADGSGWFKSWFDLASGFWCWNYNSEHSDVTLEGQRAKRPHGAASSEFNPWVLFDTSHPDSGGLRHISWSELGLAWAFYFHFSVLWAKNSWIYLNLTTAKKRRFCWLHVQNSQVRVWSMSTLTFTLCTLSMQNDSSVECGCFDSSFAWIFKRCAWGKQQVSVQV